MTLPEFSVKRSVTVLMIFFALVLVAAITLPQLPVDLMPEFDIPAITVSTQYPGAAAEDVEEKVTKILEDYLMLVPDVKNITSTSTEGSSLVVLEFEYGTDLDTRSNDVRDSIGLAERLLPDDAEKSQVVKFNIANFPILVYAFNAEESYPNLADILEDELADPLKRIPGVGSVAVRGGLTRQVNVFLDRDRLQGYNLTPQDVVAAITAENQTIPAGNLKMGMRDYVIRVPGEFKEVEPMKKIVLTTHSNKVVRLEDVAQVEYAFEEISTYTRLNGKQGAALMLQKQSGANTVEVANRFKKELAVLAKNLPDDITWVNVMDNSEDIILMVQDLSRTLMIGGILVVLVVLFFLRRLRSSFIIILAIPFSFVTAIIFIFFLDYTINMMTLFALIIAVGLVVDNAVVILENITRHREYGEKPNEASMFGASEVAMAIVASSLTTVCIFFPVLFIKGITAILFAQFAVVIIIVILASLFCALTLIPMLSSKLLVDEKTRPNRLYQYTERAFDALSDKYSALLGWLLKHRVMIIIVIVLVFICSFLLVPFIGTEFTPKEDTGFISGTIYLPVGTRVEETDRVLQTIGKLIEQTLRPEEVKAVFTSCSETSAEQGPMGGNPSYVGTFMIRLVKKVDRERSIFEMADALRNAINQVQGKLSIRKYTVSLSDPMAGMLAGGERPLTIDIIGNDLDATDQLAVEIRDIVADTPGAVDAIISREKGKPELMVDVDRTKASAMGLNVSQIADTIRASFYGREASKYRIAGDEYDIFVRLSESFRRVPQDILATAIRLPSGALVQVANLATLHFERGPVEIERKDQGRVVSVLADVSGRSLGEVTNDIREKLAALDVPKGIDIEFAGEVEEQEESFFWLILALGVGAILVYMVMASQFESLIDPFVVMFSLPFAFVGVVWALFLSGLNLNIIVFLGMLLLIGIVVNNAIVLVDYINTLRARGLKLFDAVREAGKARMRPVLMTAFTTILALVPMAFATGQGSEVWNPLGLTVMGGLLVATLVTLVIIPVMYTLFEARKEKNLSRKSK